MCAKLTEEFLKEFKKMAADVANVKKTVNVLEEKISKITSRIEILKNENILLKSAIFKLIKENNVSNDRVAEMEQYPRRETEVSHNLKMKT